MHFGWYWRREHAVWCIAPAWCKKLIRVHYWIVPYPFSVLVNPSFRWLLSLLRIPASSTALSAPLRILSLFMLQVHCPIAYDSFTAKQKERARYKAGTYCHEIKFSPWLCFVSRSRQKGNTKIKALFPDPLLRHFFPGWARIEPRILLVSMIDIIWLSIIWKLTWNVWSVRSPVRARSYRS